MKYKIVQQYNNVVITEISSVEEGEQFIDGVVTPYNTPKLHKLSPNLIVVPFHYQWMYSQRNNGYRWMLPPFDNQ